MSSSIDRQAEDTKSTIEKIHPDHVEAGATKNDKVITYHKNAVWTVMMESNRRSSLSTILQGGFKSRFSYDKGVIRYSPYLFRFWQDCFNVSPWRMTYFLGSSVLTSVDNAVALYLTNRLLNTMQEAVITGSMDGKQLFTILGANLAFKVAMAVVYTYQSHCETILKQRVNFLFRQRVIRANLRLDLPTFQAPDTANKLERFMKDAWEKFETIVNRCRTMAALASQGFMLFGILGTQTSGRLLSGLTLGRVLFDQFSRGGVSWWSTTSYVWPSNPHYRRLSALTAMIKDASHRIEIISDGLANYIIKEFNKAREYFGDESDDYPYPWDRSSLVSVLRTCMYHVISELPLAAYALQIYFSPKDFSLSAVALTRQTTQFLSWTLHDLFSDDTSTAQLFQQIKDLYELENMPNTLPEGNLKYLHAIDENHGMAITFKDVSFSYPTGDREAISNVSFTIERGQTIVVVGVNGSGKSTLLKLFNRLFDASSGTIFIDGIPIQSFVSADLRRSMAVHYQTYTHYPLSIRENIALGLPDNIVDGGTAGITDKDPIIEAARRGGALEFVEKQKQGFDTELKPVDMSYSNMTEEASKEFTDKMAEIQKKVEVSGGQWQRLALSRLFYRAFDKHVRLVAADEPSASLDPRMEYQLFESLRHLSAEQRKTLIYVTHRFGYLTKRADKILVMKDGKLVEQGQHRDLLALNGEYANLYKLQAEAFTPDAAQP